MQTGDFIRLTYTGRVKETGQVFDSAESAPVIVGAGYVIAGVDAALQAMAVGERRTIEIQPESAFGQRRPELVKIIPEAEFRRHRTTPKVGMVVDADSARGRILSVASGRVTVDFNHPLAGKILIFDLEIKEKIEQPEAKIAAVVEFYTKLTADKIKVSITGGQLELVLPPAVHPVWKKKIADDIIKYIGLEHVKFAEVFERPKG